MKPAHAIRKRRAAAPRSGFTLVEMLVAVAIVLIMMVMFTQAFVLATQSLSQQRGIAENDQRSRMLSVIMRGDLEGRTFRDLLPYRAGETTDSPRRAGYFEIDEGDPNDDTDDVLQFTTSTNLPSSSPNGSRFNGLSRSLTTVSINGAGSGTGATTANSIEVTGDFTNMVDLGSHVRITGSVLNVAPYTNDGRYLVTGRNVSGGNTSLVLSPGSLQIPAGPLGKYGSVMLSEFDPEFDDGIPGNGAAASGYAEVSYFLRNQTLYRRILLLRDTQSGGDAQPQWNTRLQITNAALTSVNTTTATPNSFWHDFDFSSFNVLGTSIAPVVYPSTAGLLFISPNVTQFHNAYSSLNNSYVPDSSVLTETLSLGLPYQRFGHSTSNSLPQDASTSATVNGVATSLGRFTLQECADPNFLYPLTLAAASNPFDQAGLIVNPASGLVSAYATQSDRRGQDILLQNVLTFDVKVWDPINQVFTDLGSPATAGGPFSSRPTGGVSIPPGGPGYRVGGGSSSSGVLYNVDASQNVSVVGGKLNSTYASETAPSAPNLTVSPDGRNHYRFDTWHPNAAITANSTTTGTGYYNQPPYFFPDAYFGTPPSAPATGYQYNEPPLVPAAQLYSTGAIALNKAFPLGAIQITVNYRDVSSNQIRSMTIIHSLTDRVQTLTKFASTVSASGYVLVPTLD